MGRRRIFLLLLSAALALSLAGCGQAEPPSASGTDFSSAAKEEQAIPARQIKKLGLGCAFLDKNAITSEGLKAAIVKLLTEPSYKETAHAFSEDMRSLGGTKASARALMEFLYR